MEPSTGLNLINKLGEIPTLIFLVVMLLTLIGWIVKNMHGQTREMKELRNAMSQSNEDQNARITAIEHDYLRKDEFYGEMGGWRNEIRESERRQTDNMKAMEDRILKYLDMSMKKSDGGAR